MTTPPRATPGIARVRPAPDDPEDGLAEPDGVMADVAEVSCPETKLFCERKDGTLPTVGSYSPEGAASLSSPFQHQVWKQDAQSEDLFSEV